jgi:(E)-4-hydroxy-3-methylbut-2-enyl-diphosphate synthase
MWSKSNTTFQEIAESVQEYIRKHLPQWRKQFPGVETMSIAVMGCIVNGPGESQFANIGISLPVMENILMSCIIDGEKVTSISGNAEEIAQKFIKLIEKYIKEKFSK